MAFSLAPHFSQSDEEAYSHILHLFWPVHQLNTCSGYLLGWELAEHCYFISCILSHTREEIEVHLLQMKESHQFGEAGFPKLLGEWRASEKNSSSFCKFPKFSPYEAISTSMHTSSIYASCWLQIYEDEVSHLPSLSEELSKDAHYVHQNSHIYFYDRSASPNEFFSSVYRSPHFCFLRALSNSADMSSLEPPVEPSRGIPFQSMIHCLNISLFCEIHMRQALHSRTHSPVSSSPRISLSSSHADISPSFSLFEEGRFYRFFKNLLMRFGLVCCLLSTLAYKLIHFFPFVETFFESEFSTFLFQILQRIRYQSQWYSLIQKYRFTSYKDRWKKKALEALILNGILLVLLDLFIGFVISNYLLKHNDEILELLSQSYYRIGVDVLTSQLDWLNAIPKKFRLNRNFTHFVNSIALTVAYVW
ncbi:hypothetical protein IE077_000554 [Cardiosporidium cionae]|uniref:Uncharacterized protein n=1 Tax=Cardiosporidium cionae TaxID=476202 RepID=A0ABQ7J847_9APIC|nr:hypothetical protein IE077_000554 [Cardiosporidium cionae]|eukprot:KAF8820156.1 hypothetical protein IE077_000554 [Cardiosporidium cionae]